MLNGVDKHVGQERPAAVTSNNGAVSLLFFAHTMDCLYDVLQQSKGFAGLFARAPHDLLFSPDLSIAYHFFKRADTGMSRQWKTIVAGVALDNVWNERKSYGLFALDFEARAAALTHSGFTAVYFAKDNFYLLLRPELVLPIYHLDFTFL